MVLTDLSRHFVQYESPNRRSFADYSQGHQHRGSTTSFNSERSRGGVSRDAGNAPSGPTGRPDLKRKLVVVGDGGCGKVGFVCSATACLRRINCLFSRVPQ